MDSKQIDEFIQYKQGQKNHGTSWGSDGNFMLLMFLLLIPSLFPTQNIFAQTGERNANPVLSDPGVVITITLILLIFKTG
jgi:hypothetical protein